MSGAPHVVIVGGGYVAIGAILRLRPAIRRGEVRVTVVDRENYKCFHGVMAELLVGRIAPTHALSPARRVFKDAKLYLAEVDSINLGTRTVATSRQVDGLRQDLVFDHLIIGLGSTDNLNAYPGLAEHAFKLKTYDDCFRLRSHILTMFEMASIEPDEAERRRLLTFFVAGGGYAGTEVAAEIAELASALCGNEYPDVRHDECRVVLVHPGSTILPELYGTPEAARRHPRLVEFATTHVRGLGVEVITDTFVTAASANEVSLSDGQRVATRTIISAVGTKPAPVLEPLDVPKDERGRLLVDDRLRVGGAEGVWAAGDCAAVPFIRGGFCPPQALYARAGGMRIATNILGGLKGEPPRRFSYQAIGQGVPLGAKTAVAELRGVELKGLLPWLMLKSLLLYYTPSWDRRLRLAADWAITAVVGRDLVESSIADADDYELRHHLYQPGEVILKEGRFDRYLHVILEGEVELLRGVDGSEEVVETLGPGGQFGNQWREPDVPESARAVGVVKTVAVRADQTRDVQRLMSHLQEVAVADEG